MAWGKNLKWMILENIADAPLDCIQFENDLIIHALDIQDLTLF